MRTTPLGPAPARCTTETPATRHEAAKPQLTTVQKSAVPQFTTHAECRRLELADPRTLDKIARMRAKVRAHVWSLIAATAVPVA